MKTRLFFRYAIREIIKRPGAFITSFLVCLSGMLITMNMLIFQYSAYQSQLELSEEKYHIMLPDLSMSDVEDIQNLDYVTSVVPVKSGDRYLAYIHLKNNDPYTLKAQCQRIISDAGLDSNKAYRENIGYQESGALDNWINNEYFGLATQNFFMTIIPVMLPLVLLTVIGVCLGIRLKMKSCMAEYAVLRSYGYNIDDILQIVSNQYTIVYMIAGVMSFVFSCLTCKAFSFILEHNLSDEFLVIKYAVPIAETIIIYAVTYLFIIIGIQIFRRLFTDDLISPLKGTVDYLISDVSRSSGKFIKAVRIGVYNKLYIIRTRFTAITRIIRKCLILLLPMIFLMQATAIYGMREQAERSTRDYGLYSFMQNYVTEETIHELEAYEFTEKVDPVHPYGDGRYMGVDIYCHINFEETASDIIRTIAGNRGLQFVDDYHDNMMVIRQSNSFTLFYSLEAAILFASALIIIISEEKYLLDCRTHELNIIRAMGLPDDKMKWLYVPEYLNSAVGLVLSSILISVLFIRLRLIPYMKPLFMVTLFIGFAVVYFAAHFILYRSHQRRLSKKTISDVMGEII